MRDKETVGPPGEDRSEPPPGWQWVRYAGGVRSADLVTLTAPVNGSSTFLLADAWVHHDAHPAVAALTEARRERDDHEHARAEAEVQIQELFARLARLEQERDVARFEAEALRGLLERCVACFSRMGVTPTTGFDDGRWLLSEITAATRGRA